MLTVLSLIFLILGAINDFVFGAFNINVVNLIFGSGSIGSRTFYIIVGLMSLWLIYALIFRRDIISVKNDFHFRKKDR